MAAELCTPPALADNEHELFDLVDDEDNVIGREKRSVCHEKGLLHRAVYCWVFSRQGELLVQRRSPHKKIGANCWDLSVAEHLSPGETYRQGVVRGLQEELGICVALEAVEGPLAPTHRRELHQGDFHDVELVQSFRLNDFEGELALDSAEVCEAKWVPLRELQQHAVKSPDQYTQWFLDEAASLGWFGTEEQ